MKRPATPPSSPLCVGWREWVALPDIGVARVKAKVDTGALTSALHAFDIRRFRRGNQRVVKFKVHPLQRSTGRMIQVVAPLLDRRRVKSSSGHETLRAVIRTQVLILGRLWEIDLSLVSRLDMGFRLLLGREALRGRFVVDPARSFVGGVLPLPRKPRKKKAATAKRAARTVS